MHFSFESTLNVDKNYLKSTREHKWMWLIIIRAENITIYNFLANFFNLENFPNWFLSGVDVVIVESSTARNVWWKVAKFFTKVKSSQTSNEIIAGNGREKCCYAISTFSSNHWNSNVTRYCHFTLVYLFGITRLP